MNPSDYFTGDKKSPTRRELQGPRPAPLRVSKDSHKIKKPPPAALLPPRPPQPRAAAAALSDHCQPVIIYAVSPKVIHTTVNEFMNLVQRLTGPCSSSTAADAPTTSPGALSPAARLASIEKTSPSERAKERQKTAEFMGLVEGIEVGQIPGILSPAPGTLQPISPAFFSPGSDPYGFSILNDLSPFMHGFNSNNSNNMFIQSPSALFSAPIISPSPSSLDSFNPFFDF